MALKDTLDRVPYWKAAAIALLGVSSVLWLQTQIQGAVGYDNARDDSTYVSRDEMAGAKERLVRIETTLEGIRSILEKMANK